MPDERRIEPHIKTESQHALKKVMQLLSSIYLNIANKNYKFIDNFRKYSY
jgi:hypothetical protein